jgi:hypothetical protein
MSKTRQGLDNKQITIFETLLSLSQPSQSQEGQFKVVDRLRGAMRTAIKNSPLSRHQIGGEMSHLLGTTITKEMIDSWTRESPESPSPRPSPARGEGDCCRPDARGEGEYRGTERQYGRHVPAEYLPAFCKVTDNVEPLRLMGQLVGLFVLPGPEALRAEIRKLEEEIGRIQKLKRKRETFLREMEKSHE